MMDVEVTTSANWVRARDTITSTVQFVGAWQGAVLVECNTAAACRFTARFMSIDLPAAIDDDVRDVVGELANMVAGNLKSLLPKGVDISMPCVVEGSDYAVRSCGAGAIEQLPFSSEVGDFRITLVEILPTA